MLCPPGRFAWKFSEGLSDNPLAEVRAEAKQAGEAWPTLSAGLFGGSYERFEKIASEDAAFIGRLVWYLAVADRLTKFWRTAEVADGRSGSSASFLKV